MKMMKLALVLLVLASFLAATAVVSMAATPTVKPMATKIATPKVTMKPTATKKLISLDQMKSNVGDVYKMLKNTTKPGKTKSASASGVEKKASQIFSDTYSKLGSSSGNSLQTSVPAPRSLSQLGSLPSIGSTKASLGSAPGKNLMIDFGL